MEAIQAEGISRYKALVKEFVKLATEDIEHISDEMWELVRRARQALAEEREEQ